MYYRFGGLKTKVKNKYGVATLWRLLLLLLLLLLLFIRPPARRLQALKLKLKFVSEAIQCVEILVSVCDELLHERQHVASLNCHWDLLEDIACLSDFPCDSGFAFPRGLKY